MRAFQLKRQNKQNNWRQMDSFNDVFHTFLGLDCVNLFGSQWDSHKPPGSHPKYLKLCSKYEQNFLERHGGKWLMTIFILGWSNPLNCKIQWNTTENCVSWAFKEKYNFTPHYTLYEDLNFMWLTADQDLYSNLYWIVTMQSSIINLHYYELLYSYMNPLAW